LRCLIKRLSAKPSIQIDNDYVKVTEWFFPPNSETGMHIHDMDYVVVPMTTGNLTIESNDHNFSKANLISGQSYSREAGVHHNVINKNDFDFTFIEIEIKK